MKMHLKFILMSSALLSFGFFGARAEDAAVTPVATVKHIEIGEYETLRANTNNVILDVRSAAEFEKGRIPGAVNIDVNSSNFTEKISALDTNKTYLVNCAVGMRSAKACQKMEEMGFNHLYDFKPGFDGWKKAGKPVEK